MGNEHSILGWPAVEADLSKSVLNLWHGLGWTGNIDAARALLGQPASNGDLYDPDETLRIDLDSMAIAEEAKTLFKETFTEPSLEACPGDLSFDMRVRQLETWLEMQPRTGMPMHASPALPAIRRLIKGAIARQTLCELVWSMARVSADDLADPRSVLQAYLTVSELAAITHMDERSIRNAIGRSGTKPLTSVPKQVRETPRNRDIFSVEVEAFQAMGWLAGRRYFRPTPVDPAMFFKPLQRCTTGQAGRILGLLIWSNVGTTDNARRQLGWSAGELDGWINHGPTEEAGKRAQLAGFLGLGQAALDTVAARRS